jgi:hypothetical protein
LIELEKNIHPIPRTDPILTPDKNGISSPKFDVNCSVAVCRVTQHCFLEFAGHFLIGIGLRLGDGVCIPLD